MSPNHVERAFQEAVNFCQTGQFSQAKVIFRQLLKHLPNHPQLLTNLGRIELLSGKVLKGIDLLKKSISIEAHQPQALLYMGNGFFDLKQYSKAIQCFRSAVELQADYSEAYFSLGLAFQELKQFEDSLFHYDKALIFNTEYVEAYNNRGSVLLQLKCLDEALASFKQAIRLQPNYADAHYNLANLLQTFRRYEEALISYDVAISLQEDDADAYINRGNLLVKMYCNLEAIKSFDAAISHKPNLINAYLGKANAYANLNQVKLALQCYDKAEKINLNTDFLLGNQLHLKMQLCDWHDISRHMHQLKTGINKGLKVSIPFPILALFDDLALQQKAAKIYSPTSRVSPIARPQNKKIRIAYFSADFHDHATMHLMSDVFENHDKNAFEIFAFSFGPDKQDSWRKKVEPLFHQFIDVRLNSDDEIVALARNLQLDIAIDLKGYTQDARSDIFAARMASVQVNYLGYPATMGVTYMDYIIADEILIPHESQAYYSEKIAYLPHCYQPNMRLRDVADTHSSRADLGLPDTGFIYCCFNSVYKITPTTFDCWMLILNQVEGSVLWLLTSDQTVVSNLKVQAEKRGVDKSRLVFAQHLPVNEHLVRFNHADLFLDTLPYNAHTTASDALREGLPLITCVGESFAARVAASILHTLNLDELIANNYEEYTKLAVKLATTPNYLSQIKQKLRKELTISPLFDSVTYTKNIEACYVSMLTNRDI